MLVASLGNFGDLVNDQTTFGATYELTRTATGWSETDIDPPASQYPFDEILDETPDLGATLWSVRGTSESLFAQDLLIREADGTLHDLGPEANPAGTGGPPGLAEPLDFGQYGYAGASSDLSHVLYWIEGRGTAAEEAAAPRLWPGDKTAPSYSQNDSLYERVGDGGGEPTLVGVKNEGPLDGSPHVNEGAELISECGIDLGSQHLTTGDGENAVSESGATIFFTARAATEGTEGKYCNEDNEGSGPPVNELYTRIGGVKTVALSEPPLSGPSAIPGRECSGVCATDEEVPADRSEAIYQGASQDGGKVFFLTAQPLVNGDEDASTDLYEAEIEDAGAGAHVGKLVQVSHDPNAGQAAEVQGVTRVSADGSHVYFVAKGELASNSSGQASFSTAQEGAENLYVYEPDAAVPGHFKTVFIAMLCSGAGESGSVEDEECHSSDSTMWNTQGPIAPAQTTSDGSFLVFSSASDLTAPEDTSTVRQVFRYDAEAGEFGELARVSIGQDGFNADGNTDNSKLAVAAVKSAGAQRAGATVVSDAGAVVFQSADGLTPTALNGQEESFEYEEGTERRVGTFYADNVYEWEPPGVKSCPEGEAGGCVSLISDGLDTKAAPGTGSAAKSAVALGGETPSGTDIFFTTADQLVPEDTDTAVDIYDAREDGGFPPPPVATPCEENCQGAPGTQPLFGASPSATFSGAGNLTPPVEVKPAAKPQPKPLARAQRLAKALKACHAKRDKRKRASCIKRARKRYGPQAGKNARKASHDRRTGR
ncbi:MAG: hypothetical protein ACRDK7_00790 [Solirubrobacteraceae bacterium]